MYETDYLVKHYTPADGETRSEDDRLASRHGSVEFLTTMRYIEKYLFPGARILEIGAGTGRYSHALVKKVMRWMRLSLCRTTLKSSEVKPPQTK